MTAQSDDSKQQTELTVKLNSKDNEAAPVAVACTLIAVDSLVNELSKAFDENKSFLLKARPFRPGSFDIDFSLAVISSATLVHLPVLKDFLTIFKQYFELKKLLKGAIPTVNEKSQLSINGKHIQVDTIILNLLSSDNAANQNVARAFDEIEKDHTITDVQIYRKGQKKPITKVSRKDFKYYKIPEQQIFDFEEHDANENTTKTILHILSPVFDKKSKWKFVADGKRLSAGIADEGFIARVESGEAFACGDKLEVELQVLQKYDKSSDSYVDREYIINKVYDHVKRKENPKLFEDE